MMDADQCREAGETTRSLWEKAARRIELLESGKDALEAENAALRAQVQEQSAEVAELLAIDACRKRIEATGCTWACQQSEFEGQIMLDIRCPGDVEAEPDWLRQKRQIMLDIRCLCAYTDHPEDVWEAAARKAETWAAERKPKRELSEPVREMNAARCAEVADGLGLKALANILSFMGNCQPYGAHEAAQLLLRRNAAHYDKFTDDDRVILKDGDPT